MSRDLDDKINLHKSVQGGFSKIVSRTALLGLAGIAPYLGYRAVVCDPRGKEVDGERLARDVRKSLILEIDQELASTDKSDTQKTAFLLLKAILDDNQEKSERLIHRVISENVEKQLSEKQR